MSTDLDLLFGAPEADMGEHSLLDERVLQEFEATNPWGMAAAIDLGGCDPALIRDPQCIEDFVVALCDLIEMKRFGHPTIVRFGQDPKVSGYSLAQLIETSLVSGHFAEESDSAYIDIFSCKAYPPYRAAAFCRDWFGAKTMRVNVVLRQAEFPGRYLAGENGDLAVRPGGVHLHDHSVLQHL